MSPKQGRWSFFYELVSYAVNQPLIHPTLMTYSWPQKAKRTRNSEAVNIFLCIAPHCITGSLAPLRLDYLPAKQKQAGCLLWAVSCGDKIRWEIFRPLSSPLNSVVSFSSAPHQKGSVALQNNRKREKWSGGTSERMGNNNASHCQNAKKKGRIAPKENVRVCARATSQRI